MLLNGAHCSRIGAGQIVFEQNDPAESLFLVFEGVIDLSASSLDGQEDRKIGQCEATEFFGELAVLEKSGRSARATTRVPCILMQINAGTFFRLLEAETRTLTRNLLLQSSTNLRRANERVVGEVVDSERRQIFRSVVQWLLESKQDVLTGLRLNADMLCNSNISEDLEAVAARMSEQVEEFISVFGAMHEYATGSPSPLQPVECDVRTLYSGMEDRLKGMVRGRQLHLDGYAERVSLFQDEKLLRRMILHLFSGIIPMAEPQSLVEFRIGRIGSNLEIRIAYLHPGITEFQALRLFEPFVSDGLGGRTGIDLALVRVWSLKMNGKATLQQKAGDRVTLSVILPLQETT